MYRLANKRFAAAVLDEAATDSPVVLVQDYQVALAPEMIRQRLPQSTIIAFWHIPFPEPGDFAVCPWGRSLLEGMLGSSIVGFQTPDDCRNFFDTIEHQLGAVVNRARNTVRHHGRDISIRAYPASIEWPSRWASESACIDTCRADVRARLQLATDTRLVLGVDRLDYTKGIAEKFAAVERLLETHPEYLGRLAFVQVAEPSRECLPAYRELRLRLANRAEQINSRFGTGADRPIILLDTRHEPADVHRLMRAADICYVGSLHDGMNLVAKEFVSARDDNRGVLILSQFAGAARELRAALIVNPYATDDCARSLAVALTMPAEEQSRRMLAMRAVIARFNTYRWAGDMLADALDIRRRTLYANDAIRRRWPQPAIRV
jgi:trehalose 6-phosphate synthase